MQGWPTERAAAADREADALAGAARARALGAER
jgi:hypothetical protein